MDTQGGRAPPDEMRQDTNKTKQDKTKKKIRKLKVPPRPGSPPTKTNKTCIFRNRKDRKIKQNQNTTKQHSFEAATEVCSTTTTAVVVTIAPQTGSTYSVVGLVPSDPVCRLLPAFVNRVFHTSWTAVWQYRCHAPPGGDATKNKTKLNKNEKNNTRMSKNSTFSQGLRRILVGSGFLQSVSYIKPTATKPRKIICCGKKWPKCHFQPDFSWVGLALGWGVCRFHDNIYMLSNPT